MNKIVQSGRWARMPAGLLLLWALTAQAATANIWQSTFGQRWFHESRNWSGQVLAGRWWEASLQPGNTYQISFQVKHLQGRAGLFIGNRKAITIDREGWHSYDFKIWNGGKRRMMFVSQGRNTTATVSNISVTQSGTPTANSGRNWMPKGHYWSFSRKRNLRTEMMNLIDRPASARSNWHLNIARDLHYALKSPGVKGFSIRFDWRDLETADGRFDWSVIDANMAVARRLGLKFIVEIGTHSFDGSNVLPKYFPAQYVIWTTNHRTSGVVPKVWDPWVYNRLIRLHKQIAWRYGDNPAFGGIATSETALMSLRVGNYSYSQYRKALIKIATETQSALKQGRFFFYLNYLKGGTSLDMRKDGRVTMVNNIPHNNLVFGGPDITPDARGMPGSMTSVRVHLRKTAPDVEQFCRAEHIDLGKGGMNRKSNQHRWTFINHVQRIRRNQNQWWHDGPNAIFQFDDIRNHAGQNLHPEWQLGQLWKPWELFNFATRNFGCDYFMWNYRENVHNKPTEFWWEDVRPVIVNNQHFFR